MNVFYSMWQVEDVNFSKNLSLLWHFFNRRVLKEVRILHYLHNNNTVIIPKFQDVAPVCVYYTFTWETFVAKLFYITFFTLLVFDCSTLFFINDYFLKNENMLLHNIIFINRFHKVSFYKVRTKFRNKIKYQNCIALKHTLYTLTSWFKTFDSKQKTKQKVQKDQKLVFQNKLKNMQTYINPY